MKQPPIDNAHVEEGCEQFALSPELDDLRSQLAAAKQELGSWIDAFGSIEDQVKFIESQDKEIFAAKHRIEVLQTSEAGLRNMLNDQQQRIESLERELRHISENLCGEKIEGEVTFDMVYHFVEGQIEKQSDRADEAQRLLAEAKEGLRVAIGFLQRTVFYDHTESQESEQLQSKIKPLAGM